MKFFSALVLAPIVLARFAASATINASLHVVSDEFVYLGQAISGLSTTSTSAEIDNLQHNVDALLRDLHTAAVIIGNSPALSYEGAVTTMNTFSSAFTFAITGTVTTVGAQKSIIAALGLAEQIRKDFTNIADGVGAVCNGLVVILPDYYATAIIIARDALLIKITTAISF